MSLLGDRDIAAVIADGRVGLDPYDPALLQPASIDVRLHHLFLRFVPVQQAALLPSYRALDIDLADVPAGHTEEVDGTGGLWVEPGEFVLGCTVETLRLSAGIAASLEGRSSIARLGLIVHTTAGWIDPGFCGQVTLEIVNVSPGRRRLHPGMRVGQLAFQYLHRQAAVPYDRIGSYAGQQGPTESRFRLT